MVNLIRKGEDIGMPEITDKQYEVMKKILGLGKRRTIARNQYIGANKVLDDLVAIGWASMHEEDYLIKQPTYFLGEKAKQYTYDRFLKEDTAHGN